jgi:hypothetical protein
VLEVAPRDGVIVVKFPNTLLKEDEFGENDELDTREGTTSCNNYNKTIIKLLNNFTNLLSILYLHPSTIVQLSNIRLSSSNTHSIVY